MIKWDEINKYYDEKLNQDSISSTYPHGMRKFIHDLEVMYEDSSQIISYWNEVNEFASSGNSDTRFKVRKALQNVDLNLFTAELNKITSPLENFTIFNKSSSSEWYEKIKDNATFNIINKRIGNGIPNAVLNSLRITPDQINTDPKKDSFTEKKYKQLIIDGAPGTGKSYKVNQEVKKYGINHERVTFYQDYEYHNFVGSILPVLNDNDNVSYEFIQGPFTKILNDALSMPEEKHYLIIEELTRGNASAIFGDVFQLLDRDEDGFSEYPITHNSILNSLSPEVSSFLQTNYEGKIVLPPNLSIICTINSSDQNVYPLDTAFKRRFDYEIKNTEVDTTEFDNFDIHFGKEDNGYAISIDWIKFQKELNNFILIDLKLKEDKQVGPYFIKNYKEDTGKIESIQTKLAMYLWNDLHKVHTISNKAIFNDKVQTLSKVDELFRTGSKEGILSILTPEFKKHFGLDNE